MLDKECEVLFNGKDQGLVITSIIDQEEIIYLPTLSFSESGSEANISSVGREEESVLMSCSIQRGPDKLSA